MALPADTPPAWSEALVVDRHEQLSVNTFVQNYLLPNRPVLLGPATTAHWPVFTRWLTADGTPNFDWLAERFGTSVVSVTCCPPPPPVDDRSSVASGNDDADTAWPTHTTTFAQFTADWQARQHTSTAVCAKDALYLKDWHFQRTFPNEPLYTTPAHFQDDWLNRFWDMRDDVSDDYRFVYMGGEGTWTPFHTDVFRSYSWSANICGCKRWTLFPPGEERYATDQHGRLVHDIRRVDRERFPHFDRARSVVLLQRPGETLFVPTGWHHQVENLGDTISINHNWMNAANMPSLYRCLVDDLGAVRYALRDCTDMDGFAEHCQLVLRCNSGWHFGDFARMLCAMTRRFVAVEEDDRGLCEAERCLHLTTLTRLRSVIAELLSTYREEIIAVDHHILEALQAAQALLLADAAQSQCIA